MFRRHSCFWLKPLFFPINSKEFNPFNLAESRERTQLSPELCRSSGITKYQGSLGNFTAIQLSAPNIWENWFNCSISPLRRYFLVSLVTLHSIATLLIAFPAKMSGDG